MKQLLSLAALFLSLILSPIFMSFGHAAEGSLQQAAEGSSHLVAEGSPQLYVVKFHADWCGSCRKLGPEIIKARGKAGLDDEAVLFVTLDLTDATKRNQASLMASAIGLKEFYTKNAGKTGFALLVDPETGETKGRLTKDMSANDIIEKVSALLKS